MRKSSFYLLILMLFASCVGTDEITIDKPEVDVDAKIVVTPSNQGVLINQEESFTAIYTNEKGQIEDVTFEWLSSETSVATVDANGKASGLIEGSTIITAKFGSVTSNQATLNVVNSSVDLATITVTASVTMLYLGESTTLSASAFDLNDNELSGIIYTWESMDESVATIDSDGKVTASSDNTGTASFYALSDGKMSNVYTIEIFDAANTLIRNGAFEGYSGYSVSGSVSLEQQPDGQLTLKIEDNFMSAQGPGLVIYLANSNTQVISTGIEIQALPQLSGAFEMDITAISSTVDITDYNYVMIHCKPFNVPFGGALLGAVE
jgi:hypothetical protein